MTERSNELKPCPFCGGEPYFGFEPYCCESGYGGYFISCHKGCVTQYFSCQECEKEKAVKAWNRRVCDD